MIVADTKALTLAGLAKEEDRWEGDGRVDDLLRILSPRPVRHDQH